MISGAEIRSLNECPAKRFDIFINSTGFESRSSTLVERECVHAGLLYSLKFDGPDLFGFKRNSEVMQDAGAEFVLDTHVFFRRNFREIVSKTCRRAGRRLRVGLDISSMNRTMMASALCAVFASRDDLEDVEVFYLPASYRTPRYDFEIEQVGAVLPEFAGFDSDPTLPLGLLLGVGYEYGVALGLLNQLEPRWTLCFRAVGHDSRYETAVEEANLNFDFGAQNVDLIDYPLLRPDSAFQYIENIVYGMLTSHRVLIVPMGPKIFALISMIVALKHFGLVSVWRVASHLPPEDAVANGEVISCSIDIHSQVRQEGIWSLTQMFNAKHRTS